MESIINSIISCLNLILIICGWMVIYKQNVRIQIHKNHFEKDFSKMKWRKQQIDIQVERVYGPISQMLREEEFVHAKIVEMFGRNEIFNGSEKKFSQLSQEEQKIWMHYVEEYKIPSNMKVVEILRENRHLLYNAIENMDVIDTFIDYSIGWELLHNQMKSGVPNFYEYHYYFSFPQQFKEYINKSLAILLEERRRLIEGIESEV